MTGSLFLLPLSIVGWVFATPLKPIFTILGDGFQILFNHGGQGTGKSSMAKLFIRLESK